MQQTCTKGIQDSAWLGGKGEPMRLQFLHADKWYTHKPESVPENQTYKILWMTNGSANSGLKTRICYRVDFAVLSDHWMKMNES